LLSKKQKPQLTIVTGAFLMATHPSF